VFLFFIFFNFLFIEPQPPPMDGFRLNLVDLLKDNFLAVLDEVFTSTKAQILRSLLVQKCKY
jgi:hypothetical protein